MYYKVSYDQEFYDLFMYLRGKYPKALFDLEGIGKQTDMNLFAKEYFSAGTTADSSVDANANVSAKDIIGYQYELPKPFFRMNSYYLLWEKLKDLFGLGTANMLIEKQLTGDFYINDFGDVGRPYCFNFSCMDIVTQGLPMVRKIKSEAPKYLYAFLSQVENFLVPASNSTLGATGLADLLICVAWYTEKIWNNDNKDGHFQFATSDDAWTYVREQLVSFVYTINQEMRGHQSPFVNVSVFDRVFLEKLCDEYIFPDGNKVSVGTVLLLQESFLNMMNQELRRTPITFPVVTACFAVDENNDILDDKFVETVAKANQEFGFINIYSGKTSTLSSCCRLRSETDNEYFNAFGSGSTKIGSLGVVTYNLPRLAEKAVRDSSYQGPVFLNFLKSAVQEVAQINYAKRKIIESRIDKGFMPLYSYGFMSIQHQYSTFGVTGIKEALDILGLDILSQDGQAFVLSIMDVINTANGQMQEKYNSPHNVEQVPAENSSIKLAKKDFMLGYNTESKPTGYVQVNRGKPSDEWEDAVITTQKYPYYSNQFIPLTTKADLLDRIKLQGLFDQHFSGGAIMHANVSQRISDPEKIAQLIRHCAKQGVIYWAINYNLQECENGHMGVGKGDSCGVCSGRVVNNYCRVVGFLTSVKNWHKVRRTKDYPQRVFYKSTDRTVDMEDSGG